jgi:hypothetical protein
MIPKGTAVHGVGRLQDHLRPGVATEIHAQLEQVENMLEGWFEKAAGLMREAKGGGPRTGVRPGRPTRANA